MSAKDLSVSALREKGISLEQQGLFNEALECFVKALKSEPMNCNLMNWKGFVLDDLGLYREAIDCYDKCIAYNPRFKNAWHNKANSLFELGRFDEALECVESALSIDPEYQEALHGKGEILSKLGRHQEALKYFDMAAKANPRSVLIWKAKGNVHRDLKQYAEAITCWDQALTIDPEDKYCLNQMGLYLAIHFNEYERAIECFKKIVASGKADSNTWSSLGAILMDAGKYSEAEECLQSALKIDPHCTFARSKITELWNKKSQAKGKKPSPKDPCNGPGPKAMGSTRWTRRRTRNKGV